MFSIPVQTAIVNSIIGNAVLAGIFLYLWRVDRREKALGYWAAAYAASACRVIFRMIGLAGYPAAIYGEALFGTAMVVLLGMGARVFIGGTFAAPWRTGLLAAAAMGTISGLAAAGHLLLIVPYLIAGAVFFFAGLAMLRRGREFPGVGYSIVGFLFALYGGYVLVFSELAAASEDPRSYVFGPIINLAIGMVLLVVTQRKQHLEAEKLTAALLREAEGRRAAEDVGIQSEQHYRAIVDTTRSLIGLLTPDGTLIDVNRTALERAGIGRQDAVGRPFWDTPWWAHDDEQRQRLRQAIRRVSAGGHDRFEATHPAAGGELSYFNFFLTPIRDAAGQVVYLVSEAHDITARRRVEQTLHAAEQRFRAICDGSMLGVFVTDAAAQVTYFSRRATEITGVTEAEALAGRVPERIHPDDIERHRRSWRAAIDERKPFFSEHRHVRRDGSLAWCRIHAAIILDDGNLLGFVGTIEDINARKTAEQALRDSEERFSSFFALSPEPFAVAHYPTGEYIQVNEAWERTFGFRQEEVAGRSALDLGLWENPEDRSRMYEDILRRNQVRSGEIRLRRKNGDFIVVQISARVVAVGQNKYILWGTHDVTERRRMEKALQASEERVSRVFYLLPDLVTISSLDEGRFVDMNHQWETMMGYTREEAVGRPTAEFGIWVHPEQRQRLVEDVMRDGMVRSREIAIRSKDGREMICESSGSIFDWQGQRLLLLVTRDVTAQKALERARAAAEAGLRESEEKFQKFFALGPEPVAVVRYEDAVYIDINEAWLNKFGYRREEVVGKTPQELDFWVDFEERRQVIETLGRTGEIEGREVWYRAKDGTPILADISAKVFELNGTRYVLWDVHDITEKRQAEALLRVSEEKFSTIFHRSPVALGVTSIPEGVYLDVNETWERQFGYPRERMLGKTSLDIGLWLDPRERRQLFADLDAHPQVLNREVRFRRGDGAEMLCELSGQVFELNGRKVLLWGAHDVTEQRRTQREIEELNMRLEARVFKRTARLASANAELAEALESLKLAQHELVRAEKLAALGSLVAGVAHELNTPIGNSVTVASTLQDKTQEFARAVAAGRLKRSTLDTYLEDARTAGDLLLRSLSQANDLVGSFKQVAVDQASAQRRRFDLRLVVEEVATTLAPMLKTTPFKLELELADNIVMDSYPGPIGQVITNLVTNSLAHAFEGREAGNLRLKTWRRGLHGVEMVFTDDGVGIPEDNMKRIFDPFFTTKLGRGGSGLGLHIVYNLVTRVLGGRIQASSQPGSGTRFQISLPMKAPDKVEREP